MNNADNKIYKVSIILSAFTLLFVFYLKSNEVKPQKRSKIAIVSLYNAAYKNIGKYGDLNKIAYAKKHGYDFFLYYDVLDKTRPPAWSKILAVKRHLNDYDWIFWMDADALIMNSSIKLESLINPAYDLIITKQEVERVLNSGVFFVKNSQWSKKLLDDIYAQTQFINHPWWEQAALIHLYDSDSTVRSHVQIVPQRAMNSHLIWDRIYQQGDFIIHFYGLINKERLMKSWFHRNIQHK